jgi:hypothetical protein
MYVEKRNNVKTEIDRRSVLTAAAWSVPVVALAVAAPAAAASTTFGALRFANTAANSTRITTHGNQAVIEGNTKIVRDDTELTTDEAALVTVTVLINGVAVSVMPVATKSVSKYGDTDILTYTTYGHPVLHTLEPGKSYAVVVTASANGYETIVDSYTLKAEPWVQYYPGRPA